MFNIKTHRESRQSDSNNDSGFQGNNPLTMMLIFLGSHESLAILG